MLTVGDLVRSTEGSWFVRPPTHCPAGHLLGPGRCLVGFAQAVYRVCARRRGRVFLDRLQVNVSGPASSFSLLPQTPHLTLPQSRAFITELIANPPNPRRHYANLSGLHGRGHTVRLKPRLRPVLASVIEALQVQGDAPVPQDVRELRDPVLKMAGNRRASRSHERRSLHAWGDLSCLYCTGH